MRKHFAMESFGSDNGAVLSLEEEQLEINDATNLAASVDSDLAEAQRVIEVSDALEDLAVVADGIDEATATDLAFVDVAAQAAVAGTDVTPEEIVGDAVPAEGAAMESYIGRRISTETIRETARNIWEAIQKFLKQVWEKIESFFYKIFGTIPSLRKRIEAMGKKVDEVSGKQKEKNTVKISSGILYFCRDNTPIKNETDLKKGMEQIKEAADLAFKSNLENVAARGTIIAKALEDFTPEKAAEVLKELRSKLEAKQLAGLPSPTTNNKTRFPDFETQIGAPLMGNVSLARKSWDDSKDVSDLGALDRLRRQAVCVISTSEKAVTVPGEFEFTTMSTSAMSAILKDNEKLLDVLEEYKRGKALKDMKKVQKDIESASGKATKAMEAAKTSDDAGVKGSVESYRALLNFNHAYANWVKSPAIDMCKLSLSCISASMVAVQKSIAAYK